MNPEELIDQFPDIQEFIIDCHENTEEGCFAFLAVVPSPAGELAVWPFAYVGPTPPNPEGKIVGFIWDGTQEDANKWMDKNRQYLDLLHIERVDALGTLSEVTCATDADGRCT